MGRKEPRATRKRGKTDGSRRCLRDEKLSRASPGACAPRARVLPAREYSSSPGIKCRWMSHRFIPIPVISYLRGAAEGATKGEEWPVGVCQRAAFVMYRDQLLITHRRSIKEPMCREYFCKAYKSRSFSATFDSTVSTFTNTRAFRARGFTLFFEKNSKKKKMVDLKPYRRVLFLFSVLLFFSPPLQKDRTIYQSAKRRCSGHYRLNARCGTMSDADVAYVLKAATVFAPDNS